ncbi:MAG TPA: 2-oxoacid:acceptor oxidoreductase family protein [Symbiobacteriaceae bacterium]|nr:2-oxoacid:acceptor oxidoreductase family protein [Symbiobacteriaceae bacterium]
MAEIMLTGSGGQGMILAGIILAKAGIHDGLHVTQTQSYGPEARGGASRAEVILDTDEISFPKVTSADVILAMTQEAVDKFTYKLKSGGTLIVDPMFVHTVPQVDGRVVAVEITKLSREVTGKTVSANIVALGVINQACGLVTPEALAEAVADSVPKGTEAANRKALEAGIAAVNA